MKSVFVAMSGGVDSSVAAALLARQGYRVTGVYMKNWTADIAGVACPWKQDLADARAAAAVIDIPFEVFDFEDQYRRQVVEQMVSQYVTGRTPNPDVLCNQKIKFDLFLKMAEHQGADLVATGHYARTQRGRLMTPSDTAKDQTYFLYRVTNSALKKTLFPLQDLTKPQVRDLARQLGLPTAAKPDSQGICFVGEVGIKQFLKQYVTTTFGPVVLAGSDTVLGSHEGALFFTNGQRHGLGLGGGCPYYVTGKDMATNTVFVTTDAKSPDLQSNSFSITDAHWINAIPKSNVTYQIRTRYRAPLIEGKLTADQSGFAISLARPDRAVTPGQSAVIYDGNTVLGGGLIR